MFRVIQVEGFNICMKVKPGNKNIFIDLQPTKLTIFITFHTTTLSLSPIFQLKFHLENLFDGVLQS